MFQSNLANLSAHAPAATMDELAPWIPLVLGAVALLAIILLIVAASRRRKSERDTLDGALADAKASMRETAGKTAASQEPSEKSAAPRTPPSSGRGNHAKP